jgi:hypothetical protein
LFKSIEMTARSVKHAAMIAAVFAEELKLPANFGGPGGAADRAALLAAAKSPGFKGECGETAIGDAMHIVLGLGKRHDLNADVLRSAAARLVKKLDRLAPKAVHLLVADTIPAKKIDLDSAGRAFAEGMALAYWRFQDFAG